MRGGGAHIQANRGCWCVERSSRQGVCGLLSLLQSWAQQKPMRTIEQRRQGELRPTSNGGSSALIRGRRGARRLSNAVRSMQSTTKLDMAYRAASCRPSRAARAVASPSACSSTTPSACTQGPQMLRNIMVSKEWRTVHTAKQQNTDTHMHTHGASVWWSKMLLARNNYCTAICHFGLVTHCRLQCMPLAACRHSHHESATAHS